MGKLFPFNTCSDSQRASTGDGAAKGVLVVRLKCDTDPDIPPP